MKSKALHKNPKIKRKATAQNKHTDLATKGWPEGYFDLFGAWQGEPLVRPEQPSYELEERLELSTSKN